MDKNLKKLLDLYNDKNFLLAEKKCKELIGKIKPNFEIFNIYAVILYELNKYDEAIVYWEKAIKLNQNYFFGYNNIGNVYFKKNEIENAILNYDKALNLKNDYYEAYHNRGNAFLKIRKFEKALDDYNKALKIKSDYLPSIKNKYKIYIKQKNFQLALSEIDKIIFYEPDNKKILIDKAEIFFEMNQLKEASENYKQALNDNPDLSFILGNLIHTKTKMCEWDNLDNELDSLELKINDNMKSSPPYQVLTFFDNPKLQLKCAKIWQKEYILNNRKKVQFNIKKKHKIKIGFYSSDFRTHAMGHLIVRMLELHNKEKFELHGFYFGPEINKNDLLQERIFKCFNSFEDITDWENLKVAEISRYKEIDIAIDLMGYTGNDNRFGIFVNRAAPIQINFLGYPGTSGSKSMDYIVADKILIPKEEQKFYSEKIIYLPDTYQPNEENKNISKIELSRKKLGLPENYFVFCCFNTHQKISKKIFSVWMKILKQNKESVLWLLKDNKFSEKNLKSFAFNQGVEPERLIFAENVSLGEHLARLRFADLLLDTYPYNAHTSCSDALRMGVPVVTLVGRSFASRVAASLLNTMKLKNLITNDIKEYEKLVLKISSDKNFYNKIKFQTLENKKTSNLFNTTIYTRNIEQMYEKIYKKNLNGEIPQNIEL